MKYVQYSILSVTYSTLSKIRTQPWAAFCLPINFEGNRRALSDFIEAVYVHPMLDRDAMVVQTVAEINRRFDMEELPIVVDKLEALGTDITLP